MATQILSDMKLAWHTINVEIHCALRHDSISAMATSSPSLPDVTPFAVQYVSKIQSTLST
jgi:hypothetical protein